MMNKNFRTITLTTSDLEALRLKKVEVEAPLIESRRRYLEALDTIAWHYTMRVVELKKELARAIWEEEYLGAPSYRKEVIKIKIREAKLAESGYKRRISKMVKDSFQNHPGMYDEAQFWADNEEMGAPLTLQERNPEIPEDESPQDFSGTWKSMEVKLQKELSSEKNHWRVSVQKRLRAQLLELAEWRTAHPEYFRPEEGFAAALNMAALAEHNANTEAMAKAVASVEAIKAALKEETPDEFESALADIKAMLGL